MVGKTKMNKLRVVDAYDVDIDQLVIESLKESVYLNRNFNDVEQEMALLKVLSYYMPNRDYDEFVQQLESS